MSLQPGSRLGAYEILSPLGAGGMGEVFRARDTSLKRDVALKVLPGSWSHDPDRLRRFETEAQSAAALNHPNILSVFQIGQQDGIPYIVTELLEGESLRDRIVRSPMRQRDVLDLAIQASRGLAAAHYIGIVHRDLKPENLFITKDGRLKILDFGLAKMTQAKAVSADGATMTAQPHTSIGQVLGTVGYMSPEQVRGEVADARSDIFALGAVIYEMLGGKRAFQKETSAETMSAILKEDPPELVESGHQVPPAVDRIVRRCLEKHPDQRFQSAKDLAFALENATTTSGASSVQQKSKRINLRFPVLALLGVIIVTGIVVYGLRARKPDRGPHFQELTFTRGYLRTARFAPDGQTVVFGGAWNGDPIRLYFQRAGTTDFSPLPLPDGSDLLAVSSSGELAIALHRRMPQMNVRLGTLARVPFTGGSPREILDNVLDADWGPGGETLAVTHAVAGRFRLEYPIGKVLYENDGYISHIRFSHDGKLIAFMDHPYYGDDRGTICVVDLMGKKRTLTGEMIGMQGLAWSPNDEEVWFGGSSPTSESTRLQLRAVSLSGRERVVYDAPVRMAMQDVSRDGRVVFSTEMQRADVMLGETDPMKYRDFTWFDANWFQTLSDDGQWLLFSTAIGSGTNYSIFARKTDGSPAVRLGDGNGFGFSRDGKWAIGMLMGSDNKLVLIPLNAGETKTLESPALHYRFAFGLPDGQHLLTVASESGHDVRSYLQSIDGGPARPLTPDGITALAVSPDGKHFVGRSEAAKFSIYDVEHGSSRELAGIGPNENVVQWLRDGHTLVLSQSSESGIATWLLDINTGARKPWKEFSPSDKVGLIGYESFYLTPDAKHFVLAHVHVLSSIFVAEHLQ